MLATKLQHTADSTGELNKTADSKHKTNEEDQYLLLENPSCCSKSQIKFDVNANFKMLFLATLLLPVISVAAEVSIGTLPAEKGSCPLLDGVFVSVMRRIFSPGFHKVK